MNHKVRATPEGAKLAERIRVLRLRAGLSQQTVADQLGLARSSVCNMEKNKQGVSGRTAVKLARVLGVSVEALYGGEPVVMGGPDAVVVLADLGVLVERLNAMEPELSKAIAEVYRIREYLRRELS